MSVTADNSWDTRDGFSVPHGMQRTHLKSDCQANILGVENHEAHRFPAAPGSKVRESDYVGKLETIDAIDAETTPNSDENTSWNRVIGMWLQWSSAYEQISGKLFADGEDAHMLEALLDEMDQLRLEAVELSEGLLNYSDGT